jgi:hypothetical protein
VKYATFSIRHENYLMRQDLRAHTSAGDGRYGGVGVSDFKQLFDRRTMMRCDAVLCAALHLTEERKIEIKSRCACKDCQEFYKYCRFYGLLWSLMLEVSQAWM